MIIYHRHYSIKSTVKSTECTGKDDKARKMSLNLRFRHWYRGLELMSLFRIAPVDSTTLSTERLCSLVKLFRQLSQNANEELVSIAIKSSQNRCIVAWHETEPIGALILATFPCATGLRSHVEDVVVDEAWRKQGVATALLKEAIRCAREEFQVRTIDLTSRQEREAANRLYAKLGFVQRDTNVYRFAGQ